MKNIDVLCTRKQFLIGSGAAAVGLFCGRGLLEALPGTSPAAMAPSTTPESADNVPDFPEHHPQFDRARVKRFVIAAHVNFVAVKAMLAEEPRLINGTIDWGNGDFETALGGASHMGRRDIAEYLLEHNARMDIFAATMLGRLDIVKAAVAAFPNIVQVPGPHGIPLVACTPRKAGQRPKMFWNFCGRWPVNAFPGDEHKTLDSGYFRRAFFCCSDFS